MAFDRDILKNLAFSLDGHRISTGASKFEVKVGRERLPWKCYEDPGTLHDKGDWMASVSLEGYGKDSERELLQRLATDEESSPFLLFLESNTLASPFAAVGSAALFMTSKTFEVAMTGETSKIKQWTSQHDNSDGTRPYVGQVIYTNAARVPAPLGAGVVTPAPITLPALAAGYEAVFTVHVTKITGTGVVTVAAEILSDTPGFATPLVRGTFPVVTNEDPPGGGADVTGPIALTLILDGDVAAFPGETQWTIRFTVTDTDTDGQVEIMAAGSIDAKL